MKRVIFLSLLLSMTAAGICQVQTPQTPQFPTHQPIYGSAPATNIPATQYQQPNQVKMGATAQDINRSASPNALQPTGNSKQQEIQEIIKEINENSRRYQQIDQQRAVASTAHIKGFEDALKRLNDMLSGKVRLSVADAYYTIENAFGNTYLTREEYNNIIKESVGFIKAWMVENKLNPGDNYMVHYAIQKFMSEPLTINKVIKGKDNATIIEPITHQPFHYDYNDYDGYKDYRNLFLTKCLATGFGQCASMPAAYLVLAEGLGVKAYLSFAPQHSFIKYPDNSGYINNYEPTSNWEISDKWYKDNMFISAKAVESGIYLDTLNYRQIVANCIFDLATYYIIVDRTGREDFIINCLRSGTPHFPKNNNLPSLFVYGMHLKTMLRESMRKYGITNIDDITKAPEAKKLYDEYMGNEAYITKLGYQDIPAGMYEEMLNHQEFRGKIQKEYNISGKDKRSLFSKK